MTVHQVPNIRVWSQARDYVEAAEILLDYNRIQPATVLAALAVEILLKAFLAKRLTTGFATTEFGHNLSTLYQKIPDGTRNDLVEFFNVLDPSINLEAALKEQEKIFTAGRYFYEPTAPKSVGTDTIYFARHFCDGVLAFAREHGSESAA